MKRRVCDLLWWLSDRAEALAWWLRDQWMRVDRIGRPPIDPVAHREAIARHLREHAEKYSGVTALHRGAPDAELARHLAAHQELSK